MGSAGHHEPEAVADRLLRELLRLQHGIAGSGEPGRGPADEVDDPGTVLLVPASVPGRGDGQSGVSTGAWTGPRTASAEPKSASSSSKPWMPRVTWLICRESLALSPVAVP